MKYNKFDKCITLSVRKTERLQVLNLSFRVQPIDFLCAANYLFSAFFVGLSGRIIDLVLSVKLQSQSPLNLAFSVVAPVQRRQNRTNKVARRQNSA